MNSKEKTVSLFIGENCENDIRADDVHVWCLPLKLQPLESDAAMKLLNSHQQDRYARRPKDQQEPYLAGRYFLWRLLSSYTGKTIEDLVIDYNRLGKPYLKGNTELIEFNSTDTSILGRYYGIFVFTKKQDIGVDLEYSRRRANYSKIAAKRFTQEEQDFIGYPSKIDAGKFLKIWTRKEAYGKAKGVGINFSMNNLNLFGQHQTFRFVDSENQAWSLQQIEFAETELLACVVRSSDQPFNIRLFNYFR